MSKLVRDPREKLRVKQIYIQIIADLSTDGRTKTYSAGGYEGVTTETWLLHSLLSWEVYVLGPAMMSLTLSLRCQIMNDILLSDTTPQIRTTILRTLTVTCQITSIFRHVKKCRSSLALADPDSQFCSYRPA